MQIQEVEGYLAEIRHSCAKGDDERAHAAEDGMFRDVLRAIAEGRQSMTKAEMCALAAKALECDEIVFERWAA